MYYHSRNDIDGEQYEGIGDARLPEIMNRSELARYLRLDQVSKAKNLDNVIINLQRMRDLPVLHICRQPLYPLKSVLEWLDQQVEKEKSR